MLPLINTASLQSPENKVIRSCTGCGLKEKYMAGPMQLLRSNRLTTTISGKNKPLPKILLVLLETVCGLQGHNTPAIFAEENSGHPKLLVAI